MPEIWSTIHRRKNEARQIFFYVYILINIFKSHICFRNVHMAYLGHGFEYLDNDHLFTHIWQNQAVTWISIKVLILPVMNKIIYCFLQILTCKISSMAVLCNLLRESSRKQMFNTKTKWLVQIFLVSENIFQFFLYQKIYSYIFSSFSRALEIKGLQHNHILVHF